MKNNINFEKSKFVYLSQKSLDKVIEWSEKNDCDPLAKAFIDACFAIGSTDFYEIHKRLEKSYEPKKHSKKMFHYIDIKYSALRYRDTIGRIIFDMLKRESSTKKVKHD